MQRTTPHAHAHVHTPMPCACREAAAYALYMATNTFLGASVVAAVLFYGGTLVLRGAMSAGALVSFMLFQQSLSASFQVRRACSTGCVCVPANVCHQHRSRVGLGASTHPAQALGDVFSALSAAVGAADKVVELMKRQPAVPDTGTLVPSSFAGKIALQVRWGRRRRHDARRRRGDGAAVRTAPSLTFSLVPHSPTQPSHPQDVTFHYPARPTLRVLSGLSLTVNPGEIVALVGPSGGGKSSIVKLVERFYLPDAGACVCVCVGGGGGGARSAGVESSGCCPAAYAPRRQCGAACPPHPPIRCRRRRAD